MGKCPSVAGVRSKQGKSNAEWPVVVEALAGVAVPCLGPAPEGVLKAVGQGAAVQGVSSVPDVLDSCCILCA